MTDIRPLRYSDDRSGFCSGNPDLDRFLSRFAGQNQFRHHIGTTYIAAGGNTIMGFATVSASHIEIRDLPDIHKKGLPKYPLPVLRLSRLAVDMTCQGKGVGRRLLKFIFLLAYEMAEKFGCIGIVVDAKPEATNFYRRYGFSELDVIDGNLEDQTRTVAMFLPLKAIPKPNVKENRGI